MNIYLSTIWVIFSCGHYHAFIILWKNQSLCLTKDRCSVWTSKGRKKNRLPKYIYISINTSIPR